MTDPSARDPRRAAASSTTSATARTPGRGSGGRRSPAPCVRHRLPQRLRPRPLGQVQGAAVHPARPQPPAGRHLGGVMVLAGLDELPIGYARVRVHDPGAPRHLRRLPGAGALLARPAARHHLALPRAAARASEHLRPRPLGVAARRHPGVPAAPDPHPVCRGAARRAGRLATRPRGRGRRWAWPCCSPCAWPAWPGSSRRWSTRRGFAVVATIALLLIGNGIVTAIQGIADEEGAAARGRGGRALLALLALPRPDRRLGRRRRAADATDGHGDGARPTWSSSSPSPPACVAALVWRYRRVATA